VKEFDPVFHNQNILKIGHNLKATILTLKKADANIEGPFFNTMLAHYLIEPESSHDLTVLCNQYLGYDLYADIHSKQKNHVCERADLVFQLKDKLQQELESRGHAKLMSDIEMPLVCVLASMEYEGVKVDVDALAKMSESMREESELVQKEIYALAETEFN